MDLFRYFYPHHNPRLQNKALRHQELGELLQAATELKNALKRAELRTENHPVGGIEGEHFNQVLTAMEYVAESLETLNNAHPGDQDSDMQAMVNERKEMPGWEGWVRVLRQQMEQSQLQEKPEALKANA